MALALSIILTVFRGVYEYTCTQMMFARRSGFQVVTRTKLVSSLV